MRKILFIMAGIISLTGCSKIDSLYENAELFQDKVYTEDLIKDLPNPVKRYFQYALTEGQLYVNSLRLKHSGTFKTGQDKDWMDIEGEQYFRANPPGFIWKGKTSLFKAHDSYLEDKGNLSIYLFGFLRIAKNEGEELNQAELLRWLGESVWMPTNLLPSENKTWTALTDTSSKITFTYKGLDVYYKVYFNELGQITSLETERYMDGKLEKWNGEVGHYEEKNGMMVPMDITASWLLEDGKYTYARFHVEKFEYNKPEKF